MTRDLVFMSDTRCLPTPEITMVTYQPVIKLKLDNIPY